MRPPCNQNSLSKILETFSRVDLRFKSLNFRKIYFSEASASWHWSVSLLWAQLENFVTRASDWNCGHSQWRALNILIVSASFEHYGQFDRGTSIVNFTLEDTQLWWRHSDIQTNMTIPRLHNVRLGTSWSIIIRHIDTPARVSGLFIISKNQ